MFVVQKQRMANQKLDQLLNGYSAYAETDELIRLMRRRINSHNLDIHVDQTDIGCWFIPKN
ncbi:hypothetical protein [Alkalibacillus aidingensis]|uniref:hypothetical protein n=1 Tax=Alkalibacillus aidingensis TaxID=2747607 RepID=UPI0016604D13|nr:hypothetical protein [Alkalibacillus aidingensis]